MVVLPIHFEWRDVEIRERAQFPTAISLSFDDALYPVMSEGRLCRFFVVYFLP